MAMKKIIILRMIGGLLVFNLGACTKSTNVELGSVSDLTGTWVLKSILLGDIMDLPCGVQNEGIFEPITLTLTTTKDETEAMLLLNGRSSVNQYFGRYTVELYNETKKNGKLKMAPIGRTKMGGYPELMKCESRYFSLLEQAVDFQLSTTNGKQQLELGAFSEQEATGLIGNKGNFLIFEKK